MGRALRFEGFADEEQRKALYIPKSRKGHIEGAVLNHKGAGTHTERGIGLLLSLLPADLEDLRTDPSLADYQFVDRSNGHGPVSLPIAEGAYAEVVTRFDDSGKPIVAGRLKGGEFSLGKQSRRLPLGRLPGMLTRMLN